VWSGWGAGVWGGGWGVRGAGRRAEEWGAPPRLERRRFRGRQAAVPRHGALKRAYGHERGDNPRGAVGGDDAGICRGADRRQGVQAGRKQPGDREASEDDDGRAKRRRAHASGTWFGTQTSPPEPSRRNGRAGTSSSAYHARGAP